MAKLNEGFTFTGSFGNLSVYKMKGVDKLIVRRKGGPSKEKIRNHAKFEMTRRKNAEFGGRATMTSWILRSLIYHKPMADYNMAGPLNSLMIPIQALDSVHGMGQRDIRLSTNPEILKGFSLTRKTSFDTIVRTTLNHGFAGQAAWVTIPALTPGINFYAAPRHHWFRIVLSLGLVPDLYFHMNGNPVPYDFDAFTDPQARSSLLTYSYSHPDYKRFFGNLEGSTTPWHPVKKGMPETTLDVMLDLMAPANDHTLLLTIGIQYGYQEEIDVICETPYAGAAKILDVK